MSIHFMFNNFRDLVIQFKSLNLLVNIETAIFLNVAANDSKDLYLGTETVLDPGNRQTKIARTM